MGRPLEALPGYQLRRVSVRTMACLAEALAPLGLNVTQVSVLYKIAEHPGVTSSEIGRALGIKRANMAPLVSSLTGKGYVASKARDGRSQALYLTEAGQEMFAAAQEVVEREETRFFSVLSEAERKTLTDILARVRKSWPA